MGPSIAAQRRGLAFGNPQRVRCDKVGHPLCSTRQKRRAAISLQAAALRSAPLTICGTGEIPPREVLADAIQKVMAHGAKGDLHAGTERVTRSQILSMLGDETSQAAESQSRLNDGA